MEIFNRRSGKTDLAKLMPQEWDYERKMQDASKLLGVQPDDVVSIKIRPISRVGTLDQEYISPSIYQDIDRYLGMDANIEEVGYGLEGQVFRIIFSNGVSVLYVGHETGPEIIVVLGVIGAGAYAANQVLKLVNTICHMLAERRGPNQRKAISIEKRLRKSQKILKQIEGTARAGKRFVQDIDELLK